MYAHHMRENSPENQEKTDKFTHKRSLGQNFLTSAVVPNWMCEAGEVKKGDLVLEIGPGTGMLTKVLLEKGAVVTAVEADERAIVKLNEIFTKEITDGQLSIHHGDAREITSETLGFSNREFKVVANIPYYLSGFLLRTLLESRIQPSNLTFLIQKELAERIARDEKNQFYLYRLRFSAIRCIKRLFLVDIFFPNPRSIQQFCRFIT